MNKQTKIPLGTLSFSAVTASVLFTALLLLAGCHSLPQSSSPSLPVESASTVSHGAPQSVVVPSPASQKVSSQVDTGVEQSAVSEPQETPKPEPALLDMLVTRAREGMTINCDFPVRTTTIEDVVAAWGEPETTDHVEGAKGTYATFPVHETVFGFNKGSQIFEVRSTAQELRKETLADVRDYFGDPDYDVLNTFDEKILGYVVNDSYKLLLVFDIPTNANSNPNLKHYSVFYPEGTVNMMADDPGREW